MGIYVNPRSVAFRKALNGDIYIGETRGGLWGDGKWYDGYLLGGLSIYNPKSVVDALMWKKFKSYWTGTETYEALKAYIDMNFDGLKEAVTVMLGAGGVRLIPPRFRMT